MMATFMAKWSNNYPGQSGHIHISLKGKDGKSVFHDAKKEHNISDKMRWFIGGQQQLMPEVLAMIASTVNSYSRLIPGFWAPTDATWGVENRTCALRVIPGSEKSQRVEYRIAAADCNPTSRWPPRSAPASTASSTRSSRPSRSSAIPMR